VFSLTLVEQTCYQGSGWVTDFYPMFGVFFWGPKMRILLVEDERKVASFIARALREDTYAVDIAETGEQALEMSEGFAHDLIVLDVRLPGLSGIQVCRELRHCRATVRRCSC